MTVETKNLRIIPCTPEIFEAAIAGNKSLAKKIGVKVPENWTEFGIGALKYAFDKLSENREESGWWTYLPIHKQDNILIGSGGYKGLPTAEGTVEIGYEIAPDYRNRGFAKEMAVALIEHAFNDKRVKSIIAHTLAKENPSTWVLTKCNFDKVEEINDPDDGLIWKWELKKQ